MKDEIARTRALRLVDAPPYFVEYTLEDADLYFTSASYGATIQERRSRLRIPRTRIRVGDPKLDNSNHVYSDAYRGSRFDSGEFPLDDNYEALRLSLWLATDRAYKQALEALARKKASLKNINQTDLLGDLSPASPVSLIQPTQRKPVNEATWRNLVREVSRGFSASEDVLACEVSLGIGNTTSYLVNNEGGEFRIPDNLSTLRIRASGMAADGMPIRDYAEYLSADSARLPGIAELKTAAAAVANNVAALKKAPVADAYTGPVLFESRAAAQLFAEVLVRHLSPPRRPVADPERPLNIPSGELEGKLGSRLLPDWFDIVDDPTQKDWRGTPLLGHYQIDSEGVLPFAVPIVEKGSLKNIHATRQPVQGAEKSNGHARLPGSLGNNAAVGGNIFVNASQTQPESELRKKLLELGKQRGKQYVMVVRKMDFPSTSTIEELRRIAGGASGRVTSIPLQIFRVYPDGREELVRGLRFRNLSTRSLRDITAAGDQLALFQFLESGAPFAHMDAGGFVAGVSVVAPSILFDELELERIPGELPRPPIVPPPPLVKVN